MASTSVCYLLLIMLLESVSSNRAPQFVDFESTFFEEENIAIGKTIGVLKAVDEDDSELTFVIRGEIANSILYLERDDPKQMSIKLKTNLDRESVEQYTILFEVTDGVNVIHKSALLVVIDVNDNKPTFRGVPYSVDIQEDIPIGRSIFTVTAEDLDSGVWGLVSYKITTREGIFAIDRGSGVVTTQEVLDYEERKFYQLKIMAYDGSNLYSTTDLIINILDVQDSPPEFTELPYIASVWENASIGDSILKVRAVDGDRGVPNPVNYTLLSGNHDLFRIDSQSGIISVGRPIDRESPVIRDLFGVLNFNVLTQEVSVSQPPSTAVAAVTIRIEDVNDQTPTFSQTTYRAKVLENGQSRMPVTMQPTSASIMVYDYDENDNGRFEMVLQQNGQPFDVFDVVPSRVLNEANVLLRVKNSSALDHEKVQSITFQLIAREYLTEEKRQSSCDITVIIEDINDNWPTFHQDVYTASIPENSPRGTFVTRITATDGDTGQFGQLTYHIRGSGAELFSVDEHSGTITVAVDADRDHSLLDRELFATHQVSLEAVDSGGRRTDVQLLVSLTDVNDQRPVIARAYYEVYVRENDIALERPLRIEATDEDLSPNNVISYRIISGSGQSNFTIDESSGAISLIAPVDYEALDVGFDSRLSLVVMATDSGTPSLSSSVTVTVHVQDVNDERPYFEKPLYSVQIPENTAGDKEVVRVLAHDRDGTSPNNEISYRIENGAREKFRIDSRNGVIVVETGADLDRDLYGREYMLRVIATDRGTPSLTGTTTVTIDITDINNKLPIYENDQMSAQVPEDASTGEVVGTFLATDADTDARLSYSLVADLVRGQDDNKMNVQDQEYLKGLFDIHSGNGSVYVKNALDRERVEEVSITMQVEDLNAVQPSVQTATAQLTILITDINDNPPTFVPTDSYTSTISEGSPPGVHVKQVSAVDYDKSAQPIRYYIHHSNDNELDGVFEITEANRERGIITLRTQVDHERYSSVELIVIAVDSGNPNLSGTARVRIEVSDTNDNAPKWTKLEPEVTIDEDIALGDVVTVVKAVDADNGTFGNVRYFITGGHLDSFMMDEITGVVTVIRQLDREAIPEYHLTIEARDEAAQSNEQRKTPGYMNIILNDVNDNAPRFEQSKYIAEVTENTKVGIRVTSVRASDADISTNGQLQYSIDDRHGNASNLFEIRTGRNTGDIYVLDSLQGLARTFCMIIMATDMGDPPLSNTTSLCIYVADVNDHKPEIVQPPKNKTLYVQENVEPGQFVTRVTAEDGDRGLNGEVRYEFVMSPNNPKDWQHFIIDSITGDIRTTRYIDREEKETYFLEVRAYDLGTPSYADRRTVTIVARDVDDNPPVFDRQLYPPPYLVSTLEEHTDLHLANLHLASDPDAGSNSEICYYIVGGSSVYLDHFMLNKTTGDLHLVKSLDREVIRHLNLVIKASDDCWSGQFDQITTVYKWNYTDLSLLLVKVTLLDVNDNAPQFRRSHFAVGVTKDTQFGEAIWNLSDYSIDVDEGNNSVLSYHLKSPVVATEPLRTQLRQRAEREAFTVGKRDGLVRTNIYFQENMQGYFTLHVSVNDSVPGRGDTATLLVYLLNEEQRAKVVLRGDVDEVGRFRDVFGAFLTNITTVMINVDKVQTHQDSAGKPDTRKADMFIHAIDPKTREVLDSHTLIDLIDKNYVHLVQLFKTYNVIEIVPSMSPVSASQTEEDLQLALILVAVFLGCLLVIVCITCFVCHRRYQRKLKAATAVSIGSRDSRADPVDLPGTNLHTYAGSNPIWLKQYDQMWPKDDDTGSHNSLDDNVLSNHDPGGAIGEQEISIQMYNDEYDNYNNIPRSSSAEPNKSQLNGRKANHRKKNDLSASSSKRGNGTMNDAERPTKHNIKTNGVYSLSAKSLRHMEGIEMEATEI